MFHVLVVFDGLYIDMYIDMILYVIVYMIEFVCCCVSLSGFGQVFTLAYCA